MTRKQIALATCKTLPEPDPDEALLTASVQRQGIAAQVCAWDDPSVDWSRMDLVVLRSTWNYPDCHLDFLNWAKEVHEKTTLYNPLDIVVWNSDKKYLLDLMSWGIPVVPTVLVSKHDDPNLVTDWPKTDRWVIKPAISAGSRGTKKFDHTEIDQAVAHIRTLQDRGDVLIQPYLKSVEGVGEHAVVVIDGKISHAVRKTARFEGDIEQVSQAIAPTEQEAALATAVLTKLNRRLPYARVDMAPDDQGNPMIMELELIEPSLFLKQNPRALKHLADTLARLVSSNQSG